jgi:hypothetical protein
MIVLHGEVSRKHPKLRVAYAVRTDMGEKVAGKLDYCSGYDETPEALRTLAGGVDGEPWPSISLRKLSKSSSGIRSKTSTTSGSN